jgi:hypothetical protein
MKQAAIAMKNAWTTLLVATLLAVAFAAHAEEETAAIRAKEAASAAKDATVDAARKTGTAVREAASATGQAVKGAASEVGHAASSAYGAAKQGAKRAVAATAGKTREVAEKVEKAASGN